MPLTEFQHPVPILIVYALINRPYILDLLADRSIVRRLLEAGHDVHLIDWHEPSWLDQRLGLQDYVNRYIDNCVDKVRERSGQDDINILGYCMGGTMAAIYAVLHPEKVNALAVTATRLCFEDTGGVLELWGDEDYYDPRAVADALQTVPGEFLAAGFRPDGPGGQQPHEVCPLVRPARKRGFHQELHPDGAVDVNERSPAEVVDHIVTALESLSGDE